MSHSPASACGVETQKPLTAEQKKIAAELGRIGGETRAKKLSASKRLAIAQKASAAAAKARSKKARQARKAQAAKKAKLKTMLVQG